MAFEYRLCSTEQHQLASQVNASACMLLSQCDGRLSECMLAAVGACLLTRPRLGLIPTRAWYAEGSLTLPPVSLPRPMRAKLAATEDPEQAHTTQSCSS